MRSEPEIPRTHPWGSVNANKWSTLTLVIGVLENGPQRFGAIQRRLEGVTPKVLTATLKRLESSHLIDRTVFAAVPPHVEDPLTSLGETLVAPLAALRGWAEEHLSTTSEDRRRADAPGRCAQSS